MEYQDESEPNAVRSEVCEGSSYLLDSSGARARFGRSRRDKIGSLKSMFYELIHSCVRRIPMSNNSIGFNRPNVKRDHGHECLFANRVAACSVVVRRLTAGLDYPFGRCARDRGSARIGPMTPHQPHNQIDASTARTRSRGRSIRSWPAARIMIACRSISIGGSIEGRRPDERRLFRISKLNATRPGAPL